MANKHSSHPYLVSLLMTLAAAGCGGTAYEGTLVASDSVENDGSAQDQQPHNGAPVPDPVTVPAPYAPGESFRLVPGVVSLTALMPCKIEDSSGASQFLERRIRFEPATGDFFVDGGRVFDGGFSWEPALREFVANRVVPIGTATGEYDAKITADGQPSYYRYKLTLQDFSFQQTECFEGLPR